MPLTMSFYHKPNSPAGHIIVDRNNLIVKFTPLEDTSEGKKIAYNSLLHFFNLISPTITQVLFHFLKKDLDITDRQHFITDHCSEHDTEFYHLHYKFNCYIDSSIMEMIFHYVPVTDWLQMMDLESFKDCVSISENYFNELEQSVAAQKIECDYLQEKAYALTKAHENDLTIEPSSLRNNSIFTMTPNSAQNSLTTIAEDAPLLCRSGP
jgi:hypothetical protein